MGRDHYDWLLKASGNHLTELHELRQDLIPFGMNTEVIDTLVAQAERLDNHLTGQDPEHTEVLVQTARHHLTLTQDLRGMAWRVGLDTGRRWSRLVAVADQLAHHFGVGYQPQPGESITA